MPHKDPEERLAYFRAYRERNRERLNALNAANRRARRRAAGVPERPTLTDDERRRRHNARVADWKARNIDKVRQYTRDRRARMAYRGRIGSHAREYAGILMRDPCCYCGAAAEVPDHIVPVSRDGADEWANLTAACRSCNAEKCDRPLLMYLLGESYPRRRAVAA